MLTGRQKFAILFFTIAIIEAGVIFWVYNINQRLAYVTSERERNLEQLDLTATKLALLKTIDQVQPGKDSVSKNVFRSQQDLADIYEDFLNWLERNNFVAEEISFKVNTIENVERYEFIFKSEKAECTLELADENYPIPVKTSNYYMTFTCG